MGPSGGAIALDQTGVETYPTIFTVAPSRREAAVNISEATVVTLFLLPRLNQQLIPKFKRELKPGTRIVSHKFDMGDEWPPEKTQDVDGLMIYLWTMK